uniref:hypothetical protein n=1 Tax=Streptomyces asiaticus TaxID=114695 RepID=UPI00374D7CBD
MVSDEDLRLLGEPRPPAHRLQQPDTDLRLQLGLPSLVWNGAPPTVALRQLPRGRRARRVFTAVRRGRTRHPAIMACRHALRQAAADVATSADG